MESRVGWNRAIQSSRRYDSWVLYGDTFDHTELAEHARQAGAGQSLRFVRVPNSRLGDRLYASESHLFWHGYKMWHRRAYRVANRLHSKHQFDLVHQVNFCGYREPGYCWKLDTPFVIGPVGGTQNYPWRYLTVANWSGGIRELLRSCANHWQLRCGRRVRLGYRRAAAVLAANSLNERDLRQALKVHPHCQLETGVEKFIDRSRSDRGPNEPLRILWAGRLRTWKGLPLLLEALAQLRLECRFELRILGEGPCEKRWKQWASKLGLDHVIDWIGWPAYQESLAHYAWADVFAFTSLRDTSGTGLLEALSAGVPIVGLDHQGAADIMTDECGIRIPVTSPRETIAAFRQALLELSQQPQRLKDLSNGALRRATFYQWDRQGSRMDEIYRQVWQSALPATSTAVSVAPPCDGSPMNAPSKPTRTVALASN